MRVEEVSRGQRVELLLDGEHVSGLVINDLQMHIGGAVVHMGGIGGVHTDQRHRLKGYSRRVCEYSNRYMYDRGYDVSLLFGISDFYPKFGFASCLPTYKLTLTTRIAERARPPRAGGLPWAGAGKTAKVRLGRPEDFPRVRALYNQEYAQRTGSIQRTGRWKGFRMGSTWGSKTVTLVAATGGRILAYAGVDDREDALTVFEVAGDPRAYPALLRALTRQAVEKRVESMAFLLPPDDRFSMYARRFGGTLTVNYPYSGAGMLRVINLATLFDKLSPEFSARLQAAGFSGPERTFLLRTDVGSVQVTAGEAGVRVRPARAGKRVVVEMPQHRLGELLFGYRTVADVAGEPGVRIPRALTALLEVLFPLQWAHVSRADYF
jgi:hypothetical protein